jgi:tetratricopeptide (TPR) repeat protein
MVNYAIRSKSPKPEDSRFSVECWFDRAIRYQPEDAQVRVIYGYYLTKSGDKKGALREFKTALEMGQNDANTHYNLGLTLFDMKDYDGAMQHAKAAYDLGFQLPGLKKKLMQAGKWRE